jgi:uncharacterized protein YdiU (UPF0061 family)
MLRAALEEFPIAYAQTWQDLFRKKLGFMTSQDGDIKLIERLLQAMHDSRVDFTCFFRHLGAIKINEPIERIFLRNDFVDRELIDRWFSDYLARLLSESSVDSERTKLMNQVNPKYVLRNHLAQRAIETAQKKDFSEVSKLLDILSKPFDEHPDCESYALAPPPNLDVVEVSCSS